MHPGGGHLVKNGQTEEWVPNKHRWAPPEGTLALGNDVLRKALTDCNSITEKQVFQVNVVNKIMLHTCSRYCLVRKSVSVNENNPHSDGRPPEKKKRVVKKCRMNFGQYNEEGRKSSGKEINPFDARITEGKYPRYEGRCDHPYLVQHCGVRPLSWLANCDTQPII